MNYDLVKVEQTQRGAWESLCRSIPRGMADDLGLEVVSFGPVQATMVKSLPRARTMNRIHGGVEPGAISEGHLSEAVAWMKSEEVDFQVHVPMTPSSPESFRAITWLARHGFKAADSSLITYLRDTSPLSLPRKAGFALNELGENEKDSYGLRYVAEDVFDPTTPVWALISLLSGKEGWRCYTASADTPGATVAACGAMYIHDGVARLDVDVTLAPARERGFNRALLRKRLVDAAEEGCHAVTAQLPEQHRSSIEPLRHNLLQAGFVEAYRVKSWNLVEGD